MTNRQTLTQRLETPGVALYRPPDPERNVAHWRINGHPATIVIWTEEEWERMADHPPDAQYYSCGVWCALRLA